jgi:hypothetical protein
MDELTPPACGLCSRWAPPAKKPGKGECRRRSPLAVMDRHTNGCIAFWPRTWAIDWCGDYRPRDEPEPEDERS